MPNSTRKNTRGSPPKNATCFAYASGPLIAVALETRMCSSKNAPTGTMPESECSRRSRNEVPCPARSGATRCAAPGVAGGAVVLADATKAPYEFEEQKRTFYYLVAVEAKSRRRRKIAALCVEEGGSANLAGCFEEFRIRNLRFAEMPPGRRRSYRAKATYHSSSSRKAAPRWLYCDFSSALSSAKVLPISGK